MSIRQHLSAKHKWAGATVHTENLMNDSIEESSVLTWLNAWHRDDHANYDDLDHEVDDLT